MLQSFKEQILPQVEEVLGTQEYVKLENNDGDMVVGYADMVVRWKGLAKPVIFDLKTSSKEYLKDSVITSPQLSLYLHSLSSKFENTRTCGYIVINKHIKKNKKKVCSVCKYNGTGTKFKTCPNIVNDVRCDAEWNIEINPEAFIQVVIDDIPTQTENIVIENLDNINDALKQKQFVRNFTSCIRAFGKCSFYDLCYFNSDKQLVKV